MTLQNPLAFADRNVHFFSGIFLRLLRSVLMQKEVGLALFRNNVIALLTFCTSAPIPVLRRATTVRKMIMMGPSAHSSLLQFFSS